MKIVFATPVIPSFSRPRPHHFIRGLAERGHEVHLLTQVATADTATLRTREPGWQDIEDRCRTVTHHPMPLSQSAVQCLRSIPSSTPLRVAYARSPAFVRRASTLAREIGADVVHVDRERLAPWLRDIPAPKVLDAADAITPFLAALRRVGPRGRRAFTALDLWKMGAFERRMGHGYHSVLVTTPHEVEGLRSLGVDARIDVVPNGVDERFFSADPVSDGRTITFTGTMSYAPNVDAALWFVDRILPRIRARHPDVVVELVGRSPVRAIRRRSGPSVRVSGTVPDVLPYLERSSVFVAPVRVGGGFPNKVAEAAAAGLPIVSTSAGHRGIDALVSQRDVITADDEATFAGAVIRVMDDRQLAARLGSSARSTMHAAHRWAGALDRLEAVLDVAAARGRTSRTSHA